MLMKHQAQETRKMMEKEKAEIVGIVEKYGRVQSMMQYVNKEVLVQFYAQQPKGKATDVDEVSKERFWRASTNRSPWTLPKQFCCAAGQPVSP